jgi:hypothetical protein
MLSLLASGDKDRARLDALIERLGHNHAVAAWFRMRGLEDWAARYEFLAGPSEERNAAEEAAMYA